LFGTLLLFGTLIWYFGDEETDIGLFTTVWISKILRGARRNFPSRFAEREAHSVILFQKFRRQFALGFH